MNKVIYKELTPMMKQYYDIKKDHMDSVLMFRLGDFYEMFFDDAQIASKELDIVLTSRSSKSNNPIPMAGIPYHSSENYISRLISKGYKVAICEQLEDPDEAEGIVKRGVVRVITPGTFLQFSEDNKTNNYLGSLYAYDKAFSLSYIDFSTGDLYITFSKEDYNDPNSIMRNQLSVLDISELVVNDHQVDIVDIAERENILINYINSSDVSGYDNFINRLEYIGISKHALLDNSHMRLSLKNLYTYLEETQFGALNHIRKIKYLSFEEYMILDRHTLYSLDIFHESGKNTEGTLLKLLDSTRTAMGGRKLRYLLEHPLKDAESIKARLNLVEFFKSDLSALDKLRDALGLVYDLERIMVRITGFSTSPKDLIQLKNSLIQFPEIYTILDKLGILNIDHYAIKYILQFEDICNLINNSIIDNPPTTYKEGGVIKEGYSSELDNIKNKSVNSKNWIPGYEAKLKEETGINNIKIKYNKVLGYFIEVTKSNIDKVPDYFIRKQTLVGSERYFTEELKKTEVEINSSENVINKIEEDIFMQVRNKIVEKYDAIIEIADLISLIDVFSSLGYIAFKYNYIKPTISDDNGLNIVGGRHPIVENNEELFIDNDTLITPDINFIILTGPNMAGKSTYMRQIALISILMQIGSFVPAKEAHLPVFDRIFTRIGAHDDLYMGESTFMVEMKEMADIISNATENSLIILDEVGRGTSTYDGLSLAKALIEYIIENIQAKTIFATHFHELTEMDKKYSNIKNQTMSIKEKDQEIQFLRKVVDGTSDKSYGIHVAQLAGIKPEIINKASVYLKEYESKEELRLKNELPLLKLMEEKSESSYTKGDGISNSEKLDNLKHKIEQIENRLENIDLDRTTPLDSLLILKELKDMVYDE